MARRNGMEFRLTDNTETILRRFDQQGQARLTAAGSEWHKGVVKELRGSRSGRVYKVPGTQREYTASAPGESPASRLGDLRTSYKFIVKKSEALIGTPLHYAVDLEHGTRKMAPRPHLQKAFNKNRQRILSHLRGEWV